MPVIATWNVNSVRPRLTHLLRWLEERRPDVVLLQETKTEDGGFPFEALEDAGYNVAHYGQKTYNGVAILSKGPIEDVVRGLPGNDHDPQARYIEALTTIDGQLVRVASVYVPNGQEIGSDKFAYKLGYFNKLKSHVDELLQHEEPIVLGGDYNVAPDLNDVYAPAELEGSVCFHPDERRAFRRLTHPGMTDAFRALHPQEQAFSWWDYRGNGWGMNKGLRIDHLLLNPEAADRLTTCRIDRDVRGWEKSSDHAPVWCTLKEAA